MKTATLTPVNFFGHAVVGCWYRDAPGYVLGTMLPDFAAMIGGRVAQVHDAELAEGVSLHHVTDEAFHGAPTFVELCATARRELRELGLGRGSSRAVAHVGTELVLDGWLLDDVRARTRYVEALDAAHPEAAGRHIEWRASKHRERFDELRTRLHAWGTPQGYTDARFVTERLVSALSRRPALQLGADDPDRVAQWLPVLQRRVADRGDTLLAEVRQRIARDSF